MTVRNKWTFGGANHRVQKAALRKTIRQMEAVSGNKHKYMQEQERGVTRYAMWRKGAPVPTQRSRFGASMKRTMSPRYWRRNIRLGKRFKRNDAAFNPVSNKVTRGRNKGRERGKSRNQRYVAASVRQAKSQGRKFVYLDFGPGNRGIFDVSLAKSIKKVWNLNRKIRRTKANPMLARTLKKLKPAFPTYHRSALEEQIGFVLQKRGLRPSGVKAFIAQLS
jgi:hypothetical protein